MKTNYKNVCPSLDETSATRTARQAMLCEVAQKAYHDMQVLKTTYNIELWTSPCEEPLQFPRFVDTKQKKTKETTLLHAEVTYPRHFVKNIHASDKKLISNKNHASQSLSFNRSKAIQSGSMKMDKSLFMLTGLIFVSVCYFRF